MALQDFTLTLVTHKSPAEVFKAINNVQAWWSEDFKGYSGQINDEFEVRFGNVHYSRHKITEIIPDKKVVWLVTDSRLTFLKDEKEWNDTQNIFIINQNNNETLIEFTHRGLTPAIECYKDCRNGWTQFLELSLLPYINSGKGNPNILNDEVQSKSIK